MLVGYLGPKGSFTHDVATHSFLTSERIAYRTITDVIKAYENQEIDFAVVPVENSIEGSVHETIDYLFHQGTIQAVAEVVYPIKQQLLVTKRPPHSNGLFASTGLGPREGFSKGPLSGCSHGNDGFNSLCGSLCGRASRLGNCSDCPSGSSQ